jgi:hypothetical protein
VNRGVADLSGGHWPYGPALPGPGFPAVGALLEEIGGGPVQRTELVVRGSTAAVRIA